MPRKFASVPKKQLISMIEELKSSVNNANAFLEDVFYKKKNLFRNIQVLNNQKTRNLYRFISMLLLFCIKNG